MSDLVRLLIVDDHASYAEALQLMLGLDGRIEVVGTAKTRVEACRALDTAAVDVVLMDVSLAGSDGFSLASDLLQAEPSVRVLMLSSFAHDEAGVAQRTVECGALAFLSKSSDPQLIADAVVEASAAPR
jgi:DNA-binding NarL/FixJ family response regulator